jgi:hypothetical protein
MGENRPVERLPLLALVVFLSITAAVVVVSGNRTII